MMRTEPGVLLYRDPGKQVLELSLESNDDVSRKVVLRDDPENMETEAIISDIDLILSGENAPPATGVKFLMVMIFYPLMSWWAR